MEELERTHYQALQRWLLYFQQKPDSTEDINAAMEKIQEEMRKIVDSNEFHLSRLQRWEEKDKAEKEVKEWCAQRGEFYIVNRNTLMLDNFRISTLCSRNVKNVILISRNIF